MKAQLEAQFLQWHLDNLVNKLKPSYKEIDLDRWQVKELIEKQPSWRFQFIAKWKTIKEYKEASWELHISPIFCPMP